VALTGRRRVVTLAGADAHAKLGLRSADPDDSRLVLQLPSYESSFRTLSVHVRPDQPLSGNAADDAKAIMRAIRAGHLYTAIDGLATPPSLEFTARNASGTAGQGDELRVDGAVTLHVRTNAPPQFTTSVWDGSTPVSTDHHEAEFTVAAPDKPAVYWVDIRPAGASAGRRRTVPWVRSNAIYVRGREPLASPAVRPSITRSRTIFDGSTIDGWTVEHDTTSVAAIDLAPMIGGSEVRFRFGLSDRITPAPFVALVYDTPAGVAPSARLTLTIRAERPMRISVQLRASPPGAPAERWQRSIYVDTADGERTVEFDDLVAMSVTSAVKPPLDSIRSIMFVVDPVNTKRGASGRIWIKRAVLQE
jgi:hypothetical protein